MNDTMNTQFGEDEICSFLLFLYVDILVIPLSELNNNVYICTYRYTYIL